MPGGFSFYTMVVEDYRDNYGAGWIKLYRSIKKHWIFANESYFRAWCCILLEVNHKDGKVLIQGELLDCKRGQSLNSLNTWASLFSNKGKRWSVQNTRTFLKLLESDGMIVTKGERKTTRLTVCNYDSYQESQQTNNRQLTGSQQTANTQLTTNKNANNDNNGNKEEEDSPVDEKVFNPKNPNTEQKMRMMWEAKFDTYLWEGETDRPAMAAIKNKLTALVRKKRNMHRTEQVEEKHILDAWEYVLKYFPPFWHTKLLKSINENFNTISAEAKKADEAEKAEHRRALS